MPCLTWTFKTSPPQKDQKSGLPCQIPLLLALAKYFSSLSFHLIIYFFWLFFFLVQFLLLFLFLFPSLLLSFTSLFSSQSFYLSFFPARAPTFSSPCKTSSPTRPILSLSGELLCIRQNPTWACPPGCFPDSSRLVRCPSSGLSGSGGQELSFFRPLLGLSAHRIWWVGGWVGFPHGSM